MSVVGAIWQPSKLSQNEILIDPDSIEKLAARVADWLSKSNY